ncbi:MAG: flagellar hook-length control protein FliK [Nitrospirota bacterium]
MTIGDNPVDTFFLSSQSGTNMLQSHEIFFDDFLSGMMETTPNKTLISEQSIQNERSEKVHCHDLNNLQVQMNELSLLMPWRCGDDATGLCTDQEINLKQETMKSTSATKGNITFLSFPEPNISLMEEHDTGYEEDRSQHSIHRNNEPWVLFHKIDLSHSNMEHNCFRSLFDGMAKEILSKEVQNGEADILNTSTIKDSPAINVNTTFIPAEDEMHANDLQSLLEVSYIKPTQSNEGFPSSEELLQGDRMMPEEQNKGTNVLENPSTDREFQILKTDTSPTIRSEWVAGTELNESQCIIVSKHTAAAAFDSKPFPDANSLQSMIDNDLPYTTEDFIQEQFIQREQNRDLSFAKNSIKPEGSFFAIDCETNEQSSTMMELPIESVEVINMDEKTFVIKHKSDASIEVILEPEGMGKLDIELTLDRGVINAQISAAETIGKEFLEKNLPHILSALIDEGISVGNFSVFLKDKGEEMKDNVGKKDLKVISATDPLRLPSECYNKGMISIFV